MEKLTRVWQQNRSVLIFLALMFAARSSFADWYEVPTGSMNPTIVEGDRIFVNKAAYRIELPFTDIALLQTGTLQRGDIVVIKSKAADTRLVKRVIGLPGERIAMHNNRLLINDVPVAYEKVDDIQLTEHLDALSHPIYLHPQQTPLSTFQTVIVPEGQVLVLGDNRNNSADSRVYGFVPVEEIQGQALAVIVSLDPENHHLPRASRYFSPMI